MAREWRGSKAPAMNTFVETTSVGETRQLGRRLAQVLEPGDVIALEGDLGTGKTELVKGIAEALGDDPSRVDEQGADAAASDTPPRAGPDPGGVSCAWRLTRPALTRRSSSSMGAASSPPTTGSEIERIRQCWSDWTRS